MKKIVFFSGGIDRAGGTERALSLVANALSKEGYEVIVVSLCGDKAYYPLEDNIKLIYLHSKNLRSSIVSNLRKLSSIVREEKPDFWVDVDYILGIYTNRIRNKYKEMKWISWEHFCFYYEYPYFKNLRKIVRKMVCKKADCLIVLSKEDEKDYKDNLDIKAKLVQIYNPLPFEIKNSDASKEKIVMAAGRLTAIKGFDLLIEAWEKLENDFSDWRLVIAGDGEEKDKLSNQIAQKGLKRVEIRGFDKDISKLYSQSSIFALSSRNEGFVMVLLEAMSQGLPCVAFDCKCGVKEMIDDGENGYYVNNGDVDEFSLRLRSLMSDEEKLKIMGDKAVIKAEEFTSDIVLKQWIELLEAI